MGRLGVMHLVDSLERGGAERVALNLVNHLPRERFRLTLCTTRREGGLAGLVAEDVERLRLARRYRLEPRAIWRLVEYIRAHQIQLLHAHGTSLFIAAAASLFPPTPRLVWHVHYGHDEGGPRPVPLYRAAASRARGVIAVSKTLETWARRRLRLAPERLWLIPNYVGGSNAAQQSEALGRGQPGWRIVCVANLRPQKDHLTLLRAFRLVGQELPEARLLLVGAARQADYLEQIRQAIREFGLDDRVSLLGERDDVGAILLTCDVGVLSSASEGHPLTLLEYGEAGLPAVATSVGACPEVLDDGRAGLLVPPARPDLLASALLGLLRSPTLRSELGQRLRARVEERYSRAAVLPRVSALYDEVLGQSTG